MPDPASEIPFVQGDSQTAPVKSAEDARQGQTTGRLRWILGVSVALAVVAMAVASQIF